MSLRAVRRARRSIWMMLATRMPRPLPGKRLRANGWRPSRTGRSRHRDILENMAFRQELIDDTVDRRRRNGERAPDAVRGRPADYASLHVDDDAPPGRAEHRSRRMDWSWSRAKTVPSRSATATMPRLAIGAPS